MKSVLNEKEGLDKPSFLIETIFVGLTWFFLNMVGYKG